MGIDLEVEALEIQKNGTRTVSLHAFSNLEHISPLVFVHLLKECYVRGTCKATKKFQALQHQVHQVLLNGPRPEAGTFIVQCIYVLPIFEVYREGFSHLLLSGFRRFLNTTTTIASQTDSSKAKNLAAQLFIDVVDGSVNHDERVLLKIIEAFDVALTDIDDRICQLKARGRGRYKSAAAFVEQYVLGLIESESYMTAVTLSERFSIRLCGQSLLLQMVQNNEFRAAEKLATFMGKPFLSVLVQEYFNHNMLKHAYDVIKKNNLKEDFPEIYHKCKESSLKKLAESACWDVAEARANGNIQLLEYLVYLAMEAGYSEKVDELCERYSLEGFVKAKEVETGLLQTRFLRLGEFDIEDITWVDEASELENATSHIEGCKVVGMDCEWKPNYVKGEKPNRVSIMQIASDSKVFIVDLIKLSTDAPNILNNCLARILQSPGILKLGYNFQCDVNQLAQSYEELDCFKNYKMLLDIQNVFKEPCGGLSGLAKKILGVGLNKTRRNSNWEERPLSPNQLEYAALDAVVLIHIFRHIQNHSQPAGNFSEGQEKFEWKSQITAFSRIDNRKKSKKGPGEANKPDLKSEVK